MGRFIFLNKFARVLHYPTNIEDMYLLYIHICHFRYMADYMGQYMYWVEEGLFPFLGGANYFGNNFHNHVLPPTVIKYEWSLNLWKGSVQ